MSAAWKPGRRNRRSPTAAVTRHHHRVIDFYPPIKSDCRLLIEALERLGFSARSADRVLKLARRIADLAGRKDIATVDLSEAIGYRKLDRMGASST